MFLYNKKLPILLYHILWDLSRAIGAANCGEKLKILTKRAAKSYKTSKFEP